MNLIMRLWRRLSQTKALERSGDKLETLFFESVYRVTYVAGISTSDHSVGYKIYSNIVKILIVLLILGEIWNTCTMTMNMDEVSGTINTMLIQLIAIYRFKNMMDNKNMYKKLATSMEMPYFDISTAVRKNLVKYWANKNEKYLTVVLGLGHCTVAIWYAFPLVDDVDYNMMVGIRLPFRFETPNRYPFAYIIVSVAFTYIAWFVMTIDLIMQVHLIHLLCQFSVLGDCFQNLLNECRIGFEHIDNEMLVYNEEFVKKYTQRLGRLVEQHKLILEYSMNLRNTLSKPMLGQFATSGVLICFIGYQATTTITLSLAKSMTSFLFLGYNAFELYIICRWCDEITVESQKIGEAIYSSGWENGTGAIPGVKSTIKLVIARANKPIVLTAGGMYDLSLESYSNLVKTSYSALTVLLRFRQ